MTIILSTQADVSSNDRINNILSFLSGQAPNLVPSALQAGGGALGLSQSTGQQATTQAGLAAQQGATQAGLTSSLGERFAQPFQQQADLNILMQLLPLI